MNTPEATLMMVFFILVRLMLPLIVTVMFGYGMNRLMDYWNRNIEL